MMLPSVQHKAYARHVLPSLIYCLLTVLYITFCRLVSTTQNIEFDRSNLRTLSCGPLIVSGVEVGCCTSWENFLSHDYDAAKRFCFFFMYFCIKILNVKQQKETISLFLEASKKLTIVVPTSSTAVAKQQFCIRTRLAYTLGHL